MKKILLILAGIIVLLVACGPMQKISNLDKTSEKFQVDKKTNTIRHEEDIYHYEVEGNTIRILYPNQGVYWWTKVGNSGYGDWNEHYNDEDYIKGSILVDVVEAAKKSKILSLPIEKIGLTGGMILISIMSIFWPQNVLHLWGLNEHMSKEFFELGLAVVRIIGMITVLVAISIWT